MTRLAHMFVDWSTGHTWRMSAIVVAGLVLLGHGRSCEAIAGSRDDGRPAAPVATEYRYVVSARVRPLLFWIGRENVGDARLGFKTNVDTREYELLVGSDPQRAPFGINRWGYLLERGSRDDVTIVGIMTESDEDTAEQAHAQVTSASGATCPFKAMRARVLPGEAQAAIQRGALPKALTFRDLEAVLALFPDARMSPRRVSLPDGVAGGFLSALAGLLEESVNLYHGTGRPASRLRRTFVHGTSIHQLFLSSSEAVRFGAGPDPERALESQFEVRSAGGSISRFRITYGTAGRFARVPLRVVYRPRWWLEVVLAVTETGT